MKLRTVLSTGLLALLPLAAWGASVQVTDTNGVIYDASRPFPVSIPSTVPIIGTATVTQGPAGTQAWPITAPSALPVSAAALPLPTGASSAAHQVTAQTSLTAIDALLASLDGKVTACNTGAVTVSASALPTGAATAAHQVTAQSTLTTVSSTLTTVSSTLTTLLSYFEQDEPISSYGTSEALAAAATDASVAEYSIRTGNATGYLQRVSFSGSTPGTWVLKKNGTAIDRAHTTVESPHGVMDFSLDKDLGLNLVEGDAITLAVTNNGGGAGNFNGRVYVTIPGGEVFAPNDLTGLQLWLDADDLTTFTLSGADVTQWSDKSGEDNHATQATGGNKPDRVSGVQNSRAVVRCDGSDDFLELPDLSALVGADYTLATVISWKTGGSNGRFLHIRGSDLTNNLHIMRDDASGDTVIQAQQNGVDRLGDIVSSGFGAGRPVGDHPFDSFHQYMLTLNASPVAYQDTISQSLAGTLVVMGSGSSLGSRVCARADNAAAGKVDVAEILLYDRILTSDERTSVFTYFDDKWGL
jgi:hypothetical protein